VARVLILGGGCRARHLTAELVDGDRHAVRIVTRTESGRAAIEASGAECLIGTPDRLATLRGALDGVTIACWMLATARGTREQVRALHGPRLQSFLGQAIDTTMRGFVYEASQTDHAGSRMDAVAGEDIRAGAAPDAAASRIVPAKTLVEGERTVRTIASRNAIPLAVLRADPSDLHAWLADARTAIDALLAP
jgi:nucleoside-diphosphate-sugar epimerase